MPCACARVPNVFHSYALACVRWLILGALTLVPALAVFLSSSFFLSSPLPLTPSSPPPLCLFPQIGLDKLQVTEESVTGMKEELIALQPQLEESTRQTEAAMEVISKESVEADKVKQVVSKEEATASAEAATVKAIKDECEADLAEALPLLEAALKALDTLKPADITEVKGMKSPPAGVRRVLEAICIMKGGWLLGGGWLGGWEDVVRR